MMMQLDNPIFLFFSLSSSNWLKVAHFYTAVTALLLSELVLFNAALTTEPPKPYFKFTDTRHLSLLYRTIDFDQGL